MTAPAGKAKLAEAIARRLNPSATAIVQECVRAQCQECEEDFRVCFLSGLIDEKGHEVWINVQDQIKRLNKIEKTHAAAAEAIAREPQEIDWRPNPAPLLARFVKRFAGRRRDRDVVDKFKDRFKTAVAWLDYLSSMSSTDLSAQLYAVSRLAGGAAQRLTPKARSIPREEFFAHWGWRLVHEFAPELAPRLDLFDRPSEPQTVADYIATNWPRLSPKFRTAHNQLLEARGLPTLPAPEIDEFVPPTAAQRRKFPWKKYVTVTGLLAAYVVGANGMKFKAACVKVRNSYQD
jgi:hypothetical protein